MNQEHELLLQDLLQRALQISGELRELATDLTRQMDHYSIYRDAPGYTPLENTIKDIVLRAKLLDQAATAFFGFSVTRLLRPRTPRTKVESDGAEG